jgi:hypothetical protein
MTPESPREVAQRVVRDPYMRISSFEERAMARALVEIDKATAVVGADFKLRSAKERVAMILAILDGTSTAQEGGNA